jgi:hypothetical protein
VLTITGGYPQHGPQDGAACGTDREADNGDQAKCRFLPQFLDPSRPIAPQVALLGIVYIAVSVSVDVTYVLAASALSARSARSRRNQVRAGRVAAASYVAMGVAAAATGVRELG